MPFWPVKHFVWREPRLYLRLLDAAERAKLRWWFRPAVLLSFIAVMMFNWSFRTHFIRGKSIQAWPEILGLILLGGIFIVYVLPWIVCLCPSEVRLTDNYVSRARGNTAWYAKYAAIQFFSWQVQDGITILVLNLRKGGREVRLAVPPEISREAVHLFFLSRDVMPKPGA